MIDVMTKEKGQPFPERGARIRALRTKKDWSLQKLANATGADKSTVARWEEGADFRVRYLARLVAALDTTEAYIMRGENAPEPVSDNQSPGFVEFLAWLETSSMKPLVDAAPWVLRELRRMNPPEAELPMEAYRQMMYTFLTAEGEKG